MSVLSQYSRVVEDQQSLINRSADFWMLGGASIAFWLVCHLIDLTTEHYSTTQIYSGAIPAMFSFFALVVNFPHFMASYHLAYSRGTAFILGHWFQLLFVPILLVSLLLAGDVLFFAPTDTWKEFGDGVNLLLQPLGIYLIIGAFQSFGPELMHHLLTVMYLTVGWHYAKQVYGCFMVYARFDNYALASSDRLLIKVSLLSIWGYVFFVANTGMQSYNFLTADYITHIFPIGFSVLFKWLTPALYVFITYHIFFRRWKESGILPPLPAVAAWIAIFVWWMPFGTSAIFLIAVPFFHGLQYLPFYKKIIDNQHNDPTQGTYSFNFYFIFLIVAGFLAFNIVPETIDFMRDSEQRTSLTYWIVATHVTINIHHYFIDNAIWRMKDQTVRKWLVGKGSSAA